MDEKLIAKNFVEKLIDAGKIESIHDACSQYKEAVSLLEEKPDENLSHESIHEKIKGLMLKSSDILKEIFKEHPELFKE